MEILHSILRWVHIAIGFIGLVAFWFPVFARKGGRLHTRAGKVFVFCGYGVTISAALACTFLTAKIVYLDVVAENREGLSAIAFLAFLALATFVALRHSMRVLESKGHPSAIDTPLDRALADSTFVASLALIAIALAWRTGWTPVLLALSPIGFSTCRGVRRYLAGADPSPRAWFYEHMGATLGAGIAFHTAFAVFGMRRLLDLPVTGILGVLPWILPAAIGMPATFFWQRHYRKKFGDLESRGRVFSSRPVKIGDRMSVE